MRVFAGPNGSGKTTIFKGILEDKEVDLGKYVNADEIESLLRRNGQLSLNEFDLTITEEYIQNFFRNSLFAPIRRKENDLWTKIHVENNTIICDTKIDSYLAADIAELLRRELLKHDISFTYETVMSHAGKVEFMLEAKKRGFRVYLYYIATIDPRINISRINVRVAQHGHYVPEELVIARYYKSLMNLKAAVRACSRAYLFDNSEQQAQLIAEVEDGKSVFINQINTVPDWISKYLLEA